MPRASAAPPRPSRCRGETPAGIIASGLFLLLIGAVTAFYFFKIRGTVAMPDFVGMSWSQAKEAARQAGLRIKKQDEPVEQGTPGHVTAQKPFAGMRLKPGGEATLSVAGGADLVVVPTVVGRTDSQARAILESRDLQFVDEGQRPDARHPPGSVSGQDPPPGIEVVKGTGIGIYISSGSAMREVPDLVHQPRAKAERMAADHGFTVEVAGEESRPTGKAGEAVSQIPPAHALVDPTATTVQVVLKAAADDRSPTLIGLPLQEARKLANALNMSILVEDGPDEPKAVVVSQDPGPGGQVAGGIAVHTLAQISIPDLEGRTLQDAYAEAARSGVRLAVQTEASGDAPGVVLSEAPGAGSQVDAVPQPTVDVKVARVTLQNTAPGTSPAASGVPRRASPSPSAGAGR